MILASISYGQKTTSTDNLILSNSLRLAGKTVTGIQNDSVFLYDYKIPTSLAVAKYVQGQKVPFDLRYLMLRDTIDGIDGFGVDSVKLGLLLASSGGGGGGLSSFSFTNSTGITGTVTNSTSTPALSLSIDSGAISNFYNKVRAAQNNYNLDINTVLGNGNSATGKSLTLNSSTNAGAYAFINANTPNLNLYRTDWARLVLSTTTPQIDIYGSSPTVVDSGWCRINNKGIAFNYNSTPQVSLTTIRKVFQMYSDSLMWYNTNGTAKSTIFDTLNNKPLQMNASGNITRASFWPSSSSVGGSNIGDSLVRAYDSLAAHNSRIGANIVALNAKAPINNPIFTGSVQFPQVTTTQMNAISSPTDGLQVYNTTEKAVYFYNSDWGWESNAMSYKRKYGVEYFNEMTTATASDGIIVGSLSNGGTITALSGVASSTGIQAPSTSTNAAARYTLSTDATALVLGSGKVLFEELVRIPTLSNSTDAFYHFFGLSAQITASAQTNGVLFLYDSSGTVTGSAASGRWQVMTAAASSRTFTTTSIQVNANQWYKLTGIVNAAGTSVDFYIDDFLVATHNTNIPTAAVGFVSNLQKSAGTTARTTNLDYLYFKQKYTTPR